LAWELRERIAKKQVSPVELTDLLLRRIQELNPKLNAYVTVTADEARAMAKRAEQAVVKGEKLGPLHGVPISVKDLFFMKGVRNAAGSLFFKDYVPQEDAVVVERVRKAGAIILGKTSTPEFGLSGVTETKLGEPCRNPWDTARTSGGSSGGAGAAVAAGLGPIAIGSDGGGSIRLPSSFCGVYGIKPTQGRVPRQGSVGKPGYSINSCIGPMTWTVRDAALLLQVLAGPDSRDPGTIRQQPPDYLANLDQGVKGMRIAWSSDLGYTPVDPEVAQATKRAAQAFQELGATVEEAPVKLDDPMTPFFTCFCVGAYTSYGYLLDEDPEKLTDYARMCILRGKDIMAADYSRALRYFQVVTGQMHDLLAKYDLLMTPTLCVPAFRFDKRPTVIAGKKVDSFLGWIGFTFPFNMTGHPAANVPCGFSSEGMPIGLHVVGRWGDEVMVLRASAAYEKARPWGAKRPPVS
jgi:aspartyl-tRNA(Asn)/glutamyl-tRNA(Gln) amidotransferase subunit A